MSQRRPKRRKKPFLQDLGGFEPPDLSRYLPPKKHADPLKAVRKHLPKGGEAHIRYAMEEGPKRIAKDPNIWGVGFGREVVDGEETGAFSVTYLVHEKLPPGDVKRGLMIRKEDRYEGEPIVTDVVEFSGDFNVLQRRRPQFIWNDRSARAGTAILNGRLTPTNFNRSMGTIGGTWPRLFGGGQRGMTCAHVALGMGFRNFIANLPGSILTLFRSPSGVEIWTAAVGTRQMRIMDIDTFWPMLAPIAPIPGPFMGFVFLDCAAGDLTQDARNETPMSSINMTGTIGSARPAIPGERVYKPGVATGVTWGRVWLSNLMIPIAVGPLMIVFDTILCELSIGEGDSGAPLLTESGNHYLGSCWAGLPVTAPPVTTPNDVIILTHTLATPAHQIFWRMNLDLF